MAAQGDETVRSPGPATAEAAVIAPPAATRPYYECVFCKRGFTTAQALGGHMNIHRRDRNRNSVKPATPARRFNAPVNKCYGYSSSYPPPQLATSAMGSGSSFAMLYYTGGAGAATGVDADPAPLSPGTPSPRELSLFGSHDDHDRELQLCLGFHERAWRVPDGLSEWQQDGEPAERKQLLDLELRLGPRPRH